MNYSKKQIDDLHKALYNTFEDNINFLKVVNIDLYNKVSDLSNKIENENYQTNFDIEFRNNSFDIYDTKNKKFIYNKTLEEYSQEALNTVDFSMQGTFNDLPNLLYNVKNPNINRLFNDDINTYTIFKINHDVYKYRKIFDYFKIENKKQLKEIPTFVFFGTLLGNHLIQIDKKIKAKSYLIVEPNLEIFRLSLFVTEYKLLAQFSNVFFCIDQDDMSTISSYERFIDFNYLDNYIFKYYSTSLHDIKLFHQFTLALQNRSSTSYDHYRQLNYIENSVKNINKYKLLNSNHKNSSLSNKPVLILSPGPSLRENFEWLIKNRKKFILVAFGATIRALCEVNIKPDVIVSVDASTLIINQFPAKYKNIYKDAIVFLTTDCHPKVFKLFKKKNTFVFETNFKLSSNGIEEAPSTSVGDNTLHILLSLGFTDIYMLGTDLSFDIQTGSGYDKTHIQAKTKHNIDQYKKNIKKITNEVDLKSKYIATKANFRDDEVYSDNFFLHIIKNYQVIINHHKINKEFNIYNLSDGAYIPGTIPLKIEDVKISTVIKNKKPTLKNIINTKSSFKFSNNDLKKFNTEINFLNELIEDIKSLKETEKLNFDEFYIFTRDFSKKILNQPSYSQLLLTLTFGYMKTINNYINYYFNDIELKKTEIIIETKNLWCKQITDILEQYMNILKRVDYE